MQHVFQNILMQWICHIWGVSSKAAVNLKFLHFSRIYTVDLFVFTFIHHCSCSLNLHSIKLLKFIYMYFVFIRNNLIYLYTVDLFVFTFIHHCSSSLNLHSIKLLKFIYMYFVFIRNNLIYLKVITSRSSAEILSR